MENVNLIPLLEQLDDNVDDLEEALTPLLKHDLSSTAGKLPLLDKAHLYVLITYAIESILFSYLRLNGVDAKEHPVFRELTRVKQYFEKLKVAESAGTAPKTKLDKAAANRFIKHALAGNQKSDANPAQHQTTRKAAAHIRFDEVAEKIEASDQTSAAVQKSLSEDEPESGGSDAFESAQPLDAGEEEALKSSSIKAKGKEVRKRKRLSDNSEATVNAEKAEGLSKKDRKKRKKMRQKKKLRKNLDDAKLNDDSD